MGPIHGISFFVYYPTFFKANHNVFLVITTTIQAFKLIVQPMVMTGGGPDYSTITILQYIYEYGFRHRNIGYASAITLVFTVFLSCCINRN
ncbi:hypothetical protein GCM10020331_046570 [Ectobacillus funiculus]